MKVASRVSEGVNDRYHGLDIDPGNCSDLTELRWMPGITLLRAALAQSAKHHLRNALLFRVELVQDLVAVL